MNKIYVFSSTGNGLQIANDISSTSGDFEIISIPQLMKEKDWSISGDNIGFIFPVYYGEMPHIVRDFILNAKSVTANYIFGICSAGGDRYGHSFRKLNEALEKRNHSLNYGKLVVINSNYMSGWYYEMIQSKGEKLDKLVTEAQELSKKIGLDISSRVQSIPKDDFAGNIMPKLLSPTRYVKDTSQWDSEFAITDECTGCSICVKMCPVDNITLINKKPSFNHSCLRCMACVQFCPKSAYTINGKAMKKTKYSHPNVKRSDLEFFNK